MELLWYFILLLGAASLKAENINEIPGCGDAKGQGNGTTAASVDTKNVTSSEASPSPTIGEATTATSAGTKKEETSPSPATKQEPSETSTTREEPEESSSTTEEPSETPARTNGTTAESFETKEDETTPSSTTTQGPMETSTTPEESSTEPSSTTEETTTDSSTVTSTETTTEPSTVTSTETTTETSTVTSTGTTTEPSTVTSTETSTEPSTVTSTVRRSPRFTTTKKARRSPRFLSTTKKAKRTTRMTTTTKKARAPWDHEDMNFGITKDWNGCWYKSLESYGRTYHTECLLYCLHKTYRLGPETTCLKTLNNRFQERQDSGVKTCRKGYCFRGRCRTGRQVQKCQVPDSSSYEDYNGGSYYDYSE